MTKKKEKKALLLGSGGLRIGQAGEFDYSGSQAIKALKEEGYHVILVNPNIATVQTDEQMADTLYLEPLNVPTLRKIIQKEKPDGLLLGFGGQTALNLGLELESKGILKEEGVSVWGTSTDSIRKAEDRELFKKALQEHKISVPHSYVASSLEEAIKQASHLKFPLMMRAAFSLGGLGSGVIRNEKELKEKVQEALAFSPQLLLEEYLEGWKEIEYEVIRDRKGQSLSICNMENLDPMGVHTGESVVIAPSQTLNDEEYQRLRSVSLKVASLFKVLGECNVQFALCPKSGEYRVIEMNPRLSRSSALASKATGYPIAFVATKLALGYCLEEVQNSITKKTTAFFEPSLDYIAIKFPRWDMHKMKAASRQIGSEMKSVGEVMALGRSFPEALQKGFRMLNIGVQGLVGYKKSAKSWKEELSIPKDTRLFSLYQFFLEGGEIAQAKEWTKIDPWFLSYIHALAEMELHFSKEDFSKEKILKMKRWGFSDSWLASKLDMSENDVRKQRIDWGITPYIKQIDTLAGEVDAETNYLYLTYHGQENDLRPAEKPAVFVLGSGPYCIGSSVEFDWCAVNTARTLRKHGHYTIMINSNPETVSTDFDESDRLYFEEMSLERVLDILEFESIKGIVVSVGGQIANNLALPLEKRNFPILGTKASSIDRAENRKTFSALLQKEGIGQPSWIAATDKETVRNFVEEVGFPVIVRPSYVLSGAAMNVVHSEKELEEMIQKAIGLSKDHPVVVSKFIEEAKEFEIDGVADRGRVVIDAVSEHVENAGVHSGDATNVLPPQKLYIETVRRAKHAMRSIVSSLRITGPFNIQFIAKENDVQVIECNLRAARSFPFVSKVTGYNFIEIATEVLLQKHQPKNYETLDLPYFGVKTPLFSYHRLKGANPVSDVEMNSTGEVACIGKTFLDAFYKSWQATEQEIKGKKILVSIGAHHKAKLLIPLQTLEKEGWDIYATEGTHRYLTEKGTGSFFVFKISEGYSPNVQDLIEKQKVDLIINIPRKGKQEKTDGYYIRRLAIDHKIPLITNLQIAQHFLQCLGSSHLEGSESCSYEEYQKMKEPSLVSKQIEESHEALLLSR